MTDPIDALYRRAWLQQDLTARGPLEDVLPSLRVAADRPRLGRALLGLARLRFSEGDLRQCGALLDEGVSTLRPDDDLVLWSKLLNFRAFLALECGHLAEAIEPLTAVVRRLTAQPDREYLQASVNLGHCLLHLGDAEGARPLFEAALAQARRGRGTFGIAHCCHSLLQIHLQQGDAAAAASYLTELEVLLASTKSPQIRFEVCLARSSLLHHKGDHLASLEQALAARHHRYAWQTPQDLAYMYYRAGRAALDAGRVAEAEQHARQARDRLVLLGASAHRAEILTLCVALARRRGDLDDLAALTEAALRQPGRVAIAQSLRRSIKRHLEEVYQLREIELAAKTTALQRAREAVAAASADRQQFLATMSHELRTPLHGVIATAELLTDQPLPAPARELVDIIRSSGELTLGIVDDILDFQKLEEGRLALDPVDFTLSERIAGPIELLKPRASAQQTQLSVQLGEGLPARVHGDDRRLQQVLLNLLGNAIKFTPGGRVALAISRVGATDQLRFEIQDNGEGISASTLPTLFTPYTQATAGTARRVGGTGLGLAICKQLVELSGGQIGAESTLGEGSTFWFTMPLPPATGAAARPVPMTPSADLTGVRILLAEDHAINRLLVTRMLTSLGAEVRAVNDGEEAVRVAPKWAPDLVLMDLHMPVLDGTGATRLLRGRGYRGVILALTASAMGSDKQACLQAGMDGFLTKPVTRDAFLAQLHQLRLSDAAS